jgi:aminoglycoside phosphotransferase (APT) family kinase protein
MDGGSQPETMTSREAVATFLKRGSWRLVETIDLGTTARVCIIDRNDEWYALKTRRDEESDASALLAEYRVLRYLNATPARRYVPRIVAWLPELGGFLMECLRYPTAAEKGEEAWMPILARALRTLHSVDLPTIQGLEDDRPDVGGAVSRRLRDLFELVLRTDDFWAGLSGQDRTRLERVRARYQAYADLLPALAHSLADAEATLTHGDLAGDNLMFTQDGRLAIADWGSARISAALVDVASVATYTGWSAGDRRRFYGFYLGDTSEGRREMVHCLEALSCLYRYRACVQSLLWLNDESEGLDAVGRAYFERQLRAL